jgi:hypothetical protein
VPFHRSDRRTELDQLARELNASGTRSILDTAYPTVAEAVGEATRGQG